MTLPSVLGSSMLRVKNRFCGGDLLVFKVWTMGGTSVPTCQPIDQQRRVQCLPTNTLRHSLEVDSREPFSVLVQTPFTVCVH